MANKKEYLVGMFDDDGVLLKAVENIRAAGHTITDVFTPFDPTVMAFDEHLPMRRWWP